MIECQLKDGILDANIKLRKIWFDDDMLELAIEVSNGTSSFTNKVYADHRALADAAAGLDVFKGQIHGGVFDLQFGAFGPEYASGAFHARLHFHERGTILITVRAQSDFGQFGKQYVADEARLYLTTLSASLDDFVRGLQALSDGHRDHVELACLAPA